MLFQSGVSPLLAACTEGGEINIVKLLIESGADIDKCDKVTLKYQAVSNRFFIYCIQLIFQNGKSPLLAACGEEGDIRIVKCLVEKGADVNKCDKVYELYY